MYLSTGFWLNTERWCAVIPPFSPFELGLCQAQTRALETKFCSSSLPRSAPVLSCLVLSCSHFHSHAPGSDFFLLLFPLSWSRTHSTFKLTKDPSASLQCVVSVHRLPPQSTGMPHHTSASNLATTAAESIPIHDAASPWWCLPPSPTVPFTLTILTTAMTTQLCEGPNNLTMSFTSHAGPVMVMTQPHATPTITTSLCMYSLYYLASISAHSQAILTSC